MTDAHLVNPTAPPMDGAHLSVEMLRRWSDLENRVHRVADCFDGKYTLRQFDYVHPLHLQHGVPTRLRKPYKVPVSYWDWGDPTKPLILCCGGVANTALRFAFFASQLRHNFRVVCMDWLGRGLAGWLAHECEYQHATMVEQMRQMIMHMGARDVTVLGSSLGGSIAIDLAARQPELVSRLILNDVGPFIPAKRRQRRAEILSRFHVFRNPEDMTRRIGAAQKNDGPISDTIRLFISWQQTRWSNEDHGRIYRYDMRAMQAYAHDARNDLDQWDAWERLKCPVLLVHGMESDALQPPTIERMQSTRPIEVMHVPDTGHTPVLSDHNQVHFIREWLLRTGTVASDWTVLHHSPRQPENSGFS